MKKWKVKAFLAMLVLSIGTLCLNSVYADNDWKLSTADQMPVGYKFQYKNGYGRNFLYTDYFTMSRGSETIPVYCIQQRVLTSHGTMYSGTVIDVQNKTLQSTSLTSLFAVPINPTVSLAANVQDNGNIGVRYWNEILNDKIRLSFNVASMWKNTYHPNEYEAATAAQWFIWCQSIGWASEYMENYRDPYESGRTLDEKIEDGWRHLDVNYSNNGITLTDEDNNGILSSAGLGLQPHSYEGKTYTWDRNYTYRSLELYTELASYWNSFDENEKPNFVLTAGQADRTISPGESLVFTDTNGVFNKGEYTCYIENAPDGLSVRKDGNNLVITASTSYAGFFEGNVVIQRFGSNNPGKIMLFSNGVNQILYRGALPVTSLKEPFKAVSMKVKIQKKLTSTTGNFGDAKVANAIYGIFTDAACTNRIQTLTTDDNGEAISDFLPGKLFYMKEIAKPEGTILNDTVYTLRIEDAKKQPDNILLIEMEVKNGSEEGNLKILKRLSATDYDEEINLAGAQFTVTLKSNSAEKYLTTISGEDGICSLENIPYGTYIVEETTVPNEAYKIDNFEFKVEENGKPYEFTKVDTSKEMRISVYKELLEETVGKTDAKVSGAYFTVYTDEAATQEYKDKNGNAVIIGPTDNTGYAISGKMRTGTYYLKETTFPEGINPDATVPGKDITFKDKIYKASYDNRVQGKEVVTVAIEHITNIPKMGRVQVLKYKDNPDSTDESPAKGAVLRLTLNSNPETYYDATINQYGYAEFKNKALEKDYDPYTIPYGEYTITEVKESDNGTHAYFFVQPEGVTITNEKQNEKRIVSDNPVPAWLKIAKKDGETSEAVKVAGAKYKIWNVEKNDWVRQMITPSGEIIDEFETSKEGSLITPTELQPGKYIIYETDAPEGYYLEDDYRLPEDEKDYGKGGLEVIIDKITTGLAEDAEYPEGGVKTGSLIIEKDVKDRPLKVKLQISKEGPMLTEAKDEIVKITVDSTEKTFETTQPIFKNQKMKDVTFKIVAKEDIVSPNGELVHKAGTTVQDNVKTNDEGIAYSDELFPGKYQIVETSVKLGYIMAEPIEVELTNNDQYKRVELYDEDVVNKLQPVKITFTKKFEDNNYFIDGKEKSAVFGIYAKNDITGYNGETVIKANERIDIVTCKISIEGEKVSVTKTMNLPEGEYYVKEEYVSAPYILDNEEHTFTVKFDSNEDKVHEVQCQDIVNTVDFADIKFVKITDSSIMDNPKIIYTGKSVEEIMYEDESTLTEIEKVNKVEISQIIEKYERMTDKELEEFINNNKGLAGAEYTVYVDSNCTINLKHKVDDKIENVVITTNEQGVGVLEGIPVGEYYLKETVSPKYEDSKLSYNKSKYPIKVTLNPEDNSKIKVIVASDTLPKDATFTKADIFTGEAIPNCVFEILDKDEKVILHSVTDSEGKGYIPYDILKNGEKYYLKEISAPGIYNINPDLHEFIASYEVTDSDIKWTGEKVHVDNYRKTRPFILKKLDKKTREPLEGCVFTIAMVDKNGEQVYNAQTGEPVYLVVDAVTDKNGEFRIEDTPVGIYKFIEITPPEGYELDEDLTGKVFEIKDDSTEPYVLEVVNTGDIAVISLSAIALVSLLGIAFVVVKNKKQLQK